MNKEEMAEWLAVNVLEWNKLPDGRWAEYANDVWQRKKIREIDSIHTPEGFFEVWDGVEKKGWRVTVWYPEIESWPDQISFGVWNVKDDWPPTFPVPGWPFGDIENRFSIFYEAVYQAMKE